MCRRLPARRETKGAIEREKESETLAKLKLHLMLIDDQEDFVNPNGTLFVKGADQNVRRVAKMVERLRDRIDDVHVTMDSHRLVDISHPLWWVDESGNPPPPFTGVVLSPERELQFLDYGTGVKTRARTKSLGAQQRTIEYIEALTKGGRYPHTIWPNHCLIGDGGHNLSPVLSAAIHEWERKRYALCDVVTKGSNPWTEHFSAVMAEVPDPKDPSTQLNRTLVETIEEADIVAWAGEARSHCFANTFRDTVNNFRDPSVLGKMVILTDGTSDVPGFEKYGEDFMVWARDKGVKFSTTTDFLA